MPRTRKRLSDRGKWSEDTLNRALELIKHGRSVRSVSIELNIPRTTLIDRIKSNSTQKPFLGRKPVFTPEQELQLASHVTRLAELFYGITITDLRKLAYEVAEKLGVKHNFNETTKMAGEDWVSGFKKRNPSISLRKPSATSLSRVTAFSKTEVDLFFSNLDVVYQKHPYQATRIFNVDETGISTVQKPGKILATKGQKQVGSITSWERGRNITAVCAFSASGIYVPPMFVFPRKRMSPLLERNGPPGSIYKCTHNGWSNEVLFLEWLKHFNQFTKPSEESPVLLVLDNHGSHVSLESYEFCRANHISMLSIPPNTSHRLQPLDVAFYGPFKKAFNRECDRFLRTNRFMRITTYDIAGIFNEAYMTCATIQKAVSGFKSSGIFPYKPETFTEDCFIPHDQVQQVVIDEENDEPDTVCVENLAQNQLDLTGLYANPEPGPSGSRPQPKPNITGTVGLTKKPNEGKSQTTSTNDGRSNYFIKTLLKISPLPSIGVEQPGRKPVKKQHSAILTGTPMKVVLEECKQKRELKLEKVKIKIEKKLNNTGRSQTLKVVKKTDQNKKKEEKKIKERKKVVPKPRQKKMCRRQITFDDSSTSEEEINEQEIVDDDEMDDICDPFDSDTEMCLVCGEFGNNELWYRCINCSKWAHSECSGFDSPENYICDYCH